MTDLQNLTFTSRPKAAKPDAVLSRRNKLIERLQEQRAMTSCLIEGQPFVAYKEVYQTDNVSGEKMKVKRQKRVRAWHYLVNDKYYFEIRYGNKSIELQKGKPAIEVGPQDNLLKVIDTIIEAVKLGKLDTELKKVQGPRKR